MPIIGQDIRFLVRGTFAKIVIKKFNDFSWGSPKKLLRKFMPKGMWWCDGILWSRALVYRSTLTSRLPYNSSSRYYVLFTFYLNFVTKLLKNRYWVFVNDWFRSLFGFYKRSKFLKIICLTFTGNWISDIIGSSQLFVS